MNKCGLMVVVCLGLASGALAIQHEYDEKSNSRFENRNTAERRDRMSAPSILDSRVTYYGSNTMRTIRYRDVMWSCAYRMGLDPATALLDDQADALASYINSWVRRLYDAQDWPEWTQTRPLIPSGSHVVPYAVPSSSGTTETMGRVFKVYLLDPATTSQPFETPFKLTPDGVFVGFEHGPFVWVKYIAACPQFTSTPWKSDFIYSKDELVYLAKTGECYKSRSANNRGHDPSIVHDPTQPMTTEIVQDRVPANPGIAERTKKLIVGLTGVVPGPDPIDPPPSGSFWSIPIINDSPSFAGVATHTATGAQSLAAILADLKTQLDAALSGHGVITTFDTAALTITMEYAGELYADVHCIYTPPGGFPVNRLKVVVGQTYIPVVLSSDPVPQLTVLTLTAENVSTGATYGLVFTDPLGVEHSVEYVSLATDSQSQILRGLISAIENARVGDAFFNGVTPTIDTILSTLTFATFDKISLDASIDVPGSAWWEVVQLPQVLADPIIRGEVADVLREEGQTDRADSEEQKVAADAATATAKFTAPQFDTLTDQQAPKSRYKVQ